MHTASQTCKQNGLIDSAVSIDYKRLMVINVRDVDVGPFLIDMRNVVYYFSVIALLFRIAILYFRLL